MRVVAKEVYGYFSIQVALYMSLSMFFAKEAVRKAAIRELEDNRSRRSAFNMLQLMLPINLIMLGLVTAYIVISASPDATLEYFLPSMLCFASAITLECYLEVYYVYMVLAKDMSPSLKLKGIGIFLKSCLLYLMITQGYGLLSYALSELLYQLYLLVGYPYLISKRQIKVEDATLPAVDEIRIVTSLPKRTHENSDGYLYPYVLDSHTELLVDFAKAAALKFLLQEGEKIFMVIFSEEITGGLENSLQLQAEFSLVANFLGIFVQLIFAPVEETAFILFSSRKNPDLKTMAFWL